MKRAHRSWSWLTLASAAALSLNVSCEGLTTRAIRGFADEVGRNVADVATLGVTGLADAAR